MRKYLVLSFNTRIFVPIAKSIGALNCTVKEFGIDYNNDIEGNTQKIIKVLEEYKPEIVFSFGWWENNINIDQYENAIKRSNTIHIYWTHDDPTYFESLVLPMAKFSHYIFTTDGDSLETYKQFGIKADYLPFACDPDIHTRIGPCNEYKHDIVMLANNYNCKGDIPFPNRITGIHNILVPLLDGTFDIKVYGLWWLDQDRSFVLPALFYGGRVTPGEEASCYSSCKIALGLMSIGTSQTMLTMRIFQVLGCGTFYLTQYAPSIENLFKNHIDLVWSSDPEETRSLADFYLKNDDAREGIAKKGQELVYANHTYVHRAQKIITTVEKELWK